MLASMLWTDLQTEMYNFLLKNLSAHWEVVCYSLLLVAWENLEYYNVSLCESMWIYVVHIFLETMLLFRTPKPFQYAFNNCMHLCASTFAKKIDCSFSMCVDWVLCWMMDEIVHLGEMSIHSSAHWRGLWLWVGVFGRPSDGFFCTNNYKRRCAC